MSSNRERRNRARQVLQLYCDEHGNDSGQTTLADILTDLRHLEVLDSEELNLAAALNTSEMHFEAERI